MAVFNNLFFLGNCSNYFNRFVKIGKSYEDYYGLSTADNLIENYNFAPRDHVNAEVVVNWLPTTWSPDYLLVLEQKTDKILSRWFVVEAQRTRGQQFKFVLKRDVIADNYNAVINAPCFIEKATLNQNDPFIFNSENMNFNKIKRSENLLKDETGVGWIVGYVSRGTTIAPFSTDVLDTTKTDYTTLSQFLTKYSFDFDIGGGYISRDSDVGLQIYGSNNDVSNTSYRIDIELNSNYDYVASYIFSRNITGANNNLNGYTSADDNSTDPAKVLRELDIQYFTDFSTINNAIKNYQKSVKKRYSADDILDIWNENGKTVAYNNKIYRIKVSNAGISPEIYTITQGTALDILLQDMLDQVCYEIQNDGGTIASLNQPIKVFNDYFKYYISFEEITKSTIDIKIANDRNKLQDAPYDMFAIPYGELNLKYTDSGNEVIITTNKAIAIATAQAIGETGGTTWLYDMQLLPYFPLRDFASDEIDLDGMDEDHDFSFITATDNGNTVNVGAIFWAIQSTGTFDIEYKVNISDLKIENECSMYRLVSPNYNGIFEFNIAKMYNLTGFNVDYTYKPFNPYIHVNPHFSGLYGRDFDDARGLICGGDFSIAIATDRWAQFEVNNKNYQNIFDRQIQNLEFTQRQERITSVVNALGGTVSGVGAGAMIGGPAGAVAGGVLGLAGGVADIAMMGARQEETRNYQIDLYNMNLENIKALPNSLTKSSALTANNKIFPFVEYYTCTDEEKTAFIEKLKYNGMTVGRIGKIIDFLQNDFSFIQGQLIRLEIDEETAVVNAIYQELRKGVFIK